MLTEEQFMKGMAILMSHWPEYQCTPETVDVYRFALKDLHPQEFERAVWAHIKEKKWFPKISELREQVERLRALGRPTAAEVWARLLVAAEDGQKPEMDETTARILEVVCGGWQGLCLTNLVDLPWRFKDFERLYNEARDREQQRLTLGQEPGEAKELTGPAAGELDGA